MITNCVLSRRLTGVLFLFGIVYSFINFIQVKFLRDGEPIYSFMHWKGPETVVFVGGILISFTFVYLMLCKLDEKLKAPLMKRKAMMDGKKYK